MAKDRQDISRKLLNPFKGDKAIWFIFLVLAIISLISVFSSIGYSAVISDRTPEQAFVRHLMFVVVTFVVVILLSNFNYRQFSRASWFGYIISIALLEALGIILAKSVPVLLGNLMPIKLAC